MNAAAAATAAAAAARSVAEEDEDEDDDDDDDDEDDDDDADADEGEGTEGKVGGAAALARARASAAPASCIRDEAGGPPRALTLFTQNATKGARKRGGGREQRATPLYLRARAPRSALSPARDLRGLDGVRALRRASDARAPRG